MHRIFQKDPALLTRALQQVLGVPFPEPREFAGMNVDLTEIEPVERRVDTLLRAETDEGAYLLVVESQGEPDGRKRGSWPYYLSYLYEKYHSLSVRPLVLGPDNVPVIVDEREAERDVSLAVLSAMTHGRGPHAAAMLEPLAAALRTVDADSAAAFVQFVDSCLADPQAQQIWRDLMTAVNYFWRHPLARQVREEERAAKILELLSLRGIPVPLSVRERVKACSDLDLLDTWFERAVHAETAEDLFVDDGT